MATTVTVQTMTSRGDALKSQREQPTLYKVIMTPIIFVTFLISLTVVDLRYSTMRSQYHADAPPPPGSWLPQRLHRLVYRYRPYRYVEVEVNGHNRSGSGGGEYYRSKQRKLVKMEMQDAFEMRTTVLLVLGVLGLICAWLAWWVVTMGLRVLGWRS